MRSLTFHPPNYECEVERFQTRSTRLEYGDNEAELRTRLERRQYTVIAIKPYEFKTWLKLAESHRDKFAVTKPYTFNAAVWTAIKQYLLALANDFCGYCESDLLANSPGEVEHYRPKSAVDGDPAHPGYYWLAYDYRNYVPTCSRCNTGKGKRNQFPIAGRRMKRPPASSTAAGASLKAEVPLLLNPFEHQPEKHLRILVNADDGLASGSVVGTDRMGKTSVEVYQLNREHLILGRQKAIDDLRIALPSAWFDRARREDLIDQIRSGTRPYSFTCRTVLQMWLDEQQAALDAGRQGAALTLPARPRRGARAPNRSTSPAAARRKPGTRPRR